MKYLSQVVKGNLIEKEKGKVKVFEDILIGYFY